MLMINKAIAEATEESHKISTLRANGLLDADACAVRMNAISAKLTQLRGERRWLSENEALDETMDAIRKMTAVIKNGPEQMNTFDEDCSTAWWRRSSRNPRHASASGFVVVKNWQNNWRWRQDDQPKNFIWVQDSKRYIGNRTGRTTDGEANLYPL